MHSILSLQCPRRAVCIPSGEEYQSSRLLPQEVCHQLQKPLRNTLRRRVHALLPHLINSCIAHCLWIIPAEQFPLHSAPYPTPLLSDKFIGRRFSQTFSASLYQSVDSSTFKPALASKCHGFEPRTRLPFYLFAAARTQLVCIPNFLCSCPRPRSTRHKRFRSDWR